MIRYAHERLGDQAGVRIVDETGFPKEGAKSCGVARRYTGTAGRIENAQAGVLLASAAAKGHAVLDRALSPPKGWADDRERCNAAGAARGVRFATKPQLAERMIRRARRLGVRAAWATGDPVYGHDGKSGRWTAPAGGSKATGDPVYGHDGKVRRFPEEGGQPYRPAVPSNQPPFDGQSRSAVGAIADEFPAGVWRRASAGDGGQGPRGYGWAVEAFGAVDERGWQLWPAVRRHRGRPGERADFSARGPAATRPAELIRVAGTRWRVEECLELATGECGLGEHEVRSWTGWHRHVTLRLLALAVVAVIRSRVPPPRRKMGASGNPGERAGGAEAAPQTGVGVRPAGRAGTRLGGLATPAPAPGAGGSRPGTAGQAARSTNYGCRTKAPAAMSGKTAAGR